MAKHNDAPLIDQAEQKLLDLFQDYPEQKLPTEMQLAEQLGISRSTVRQALSAMRRKGLIAQHKRQGNRLLRSVLHTRMRIDLTLEFAEMILEGGAEPSLRTSRLSDQAPTPEQQSLFGLEPSETLLRYRWSFEADGVPAVLLHVDMPRKLFFGIPPESCVTGIESIRRQNIFSQYADQDVSHTLLELDAACHAPVAREFGLAPDRCLVYMKQRYYNIYDEPLGSGNVYFNPDIIRMTMVADYYHRP